MRWPNGLLGAVVLAVVVGLAGPAAAREVTLHLTDGRTISGELVRQTGQSVTIKIAGIESTYPRSRIQRMEQQLSLTEQFRKKRRQVEDDDLNGRYEAARWLYDQAEKLAASQRKRKINAYQAVVKELTAILDRDLNHRRADLLRNVVQEQLKLLEKKQQKKQGGDDAPAPQDGGAGGDGGGQPAAGRPDEPKLLTDEQVNLIKVFEIDLSTQPRVHVPRDVADTLFEDFRDEPAFEEFLGQNGRARFTNLSGHEQLAVLFDLRARQLYRKVEIRDEPQVMQQFRRRIHRNYAVRYCGRCHTQGKSPGLDLITRNVNRENVVYTNYMILRRTTAGGTPLIWRVNSQRAPLLQYGLPREAAATPHPEVQGWQRFFTGPEDQRYSQMVRWINSLWGQGQRYPINFSPPTVQKKPEQQDGGGDSDGGEGGSSGDNAGSADNSAGSGQSGGDGGGSS